MKPMITFRRNRDSYKGLPHPKPAVKFMPEWFKELDRELPEQEMGTAKRCIPVLDAITNGYIIPAWDDIIISVIEVDKEAKSCSVCCSVGSLRQMSDFHKAAQVGNCPIRSKFPFGGGIMKLSSPWVIETPPGYSVMVKNPPHQHSKIEILEGVVDTDSFKLAPNFPFVWTGNEPGTFRFPKGTPLIHVVPFKRERFTMQVKSHKKEVMKEQYDKFSKLPHDRYKQICWNKRNKK